MNGNRPQCMIPGGTNYYHFLTEYGLALFRFLEDHKALTSRNIDIWYCGFYPSLVQLFSDRPLKRPCNTSEALEGISFLNVTRLRTLNQYLELRPFSQFILDHVAPPTVEMGITLIKRLGRRRYREHDILLASLRAAYSIPVREVALERLTFIEQVQLMRATKILIGAHGAGMTNLMFMPPGGQIIELYPKGFCSRIFSHLAHAFGHIYREIESIHPSKFGKSPTPRVLEYIQSKGWPNRMQCCLWQPNSSEMGKVLRDVAEFSIAVDLVLRELHCQQSSYQFIYINRLTSSGEPLDYSIQSST